MINELPTIFEVVTGAAKKEVKEKPSSNHGSNKSKSNSKAVITFLGILISICEKLGEAHSFYLFLIN